MKDESETVDTMADRIGRALGDAMGGRFNVLGNLSKEREAESIVRTLQIVDRWAEPDFRLTIAPAVPVIQGEEADSLEDVAFMLESKAAAYEATVKNYVSQGIEVAENGPLTRRAKAHRRAAAIIRHQIECEA
jgi:hypothetical protein